MANKFFPLVVDSFNLNLKELLSGDSLDLTGSTIANSSAIITLPTVTGTLATLDGTETLTNKTYSSGALTGTFSGDATYSGSIAFSATTALTIPVGTTIERPTAATGQIRFNSSLTSFEGYNGTAWSSLGGVKSVDSFTYIQAETSSGASNGDLDFFAEDAAGTAATQIGQWNRTNLKDYTGTLVGTQTTQNVFNSTATTVNAFGAASTIALGKDGSTVTTLQGKLTAAGTFHTSHLTTYGSLFIDGTSTNNIMQVSSLTRASGLGMWSTGGASRLYSQADIELRVGVTLRDQDTPTGGLTAVTITTGTGAVSLANNLTVTGDVAVNGGDVTTTSTTATLFNATATTLNIGGAATTVSIGAATGTLTLNNANTVITGNLTVNGTTTTINSTITSIDDIEFELGAVATPTDITAAGGGIRLKGTTDKTINWGSATGWSSSEDFSVVTGKVFRINGTSVLSATTLGSGVTGSSLTSVGTIGTGVWQGTIVGPTYGGTGVNNGTNTLTLAGNVSHAGAFTQTFTATATTSVTLPTTGTLATLAGAETLTNKTIAAASNTISGLTNANLSGTAGITNANLANSSVTINGSSVALGASITVTATATNALTIGTGLSGTSYNGSSAVTIAIDSTVVTLTGTQTLTNKTLTSPIMTTPTLGVASATSINKVAITAPTTGSTLTIADGKTLTASNTLTFTGTDASSVAFGAGGTVLYSGGALGTPSSGTLTNATGLPISTGVSGLGTGVATFLATPSSANLISAITDETGSGVLVFGTSPAITTSLTTPSASFDLINTNATTVNFAKAATALSIGASTGTTTVNNGLVVTGDLTVNGTTTTINATTISVDDKNIELGSVATPTNTTADGGGITLKGATDKTFNWVNATAAWTSSEDLNLLTGKVYEINGTTVLSSTTLGTGVTASSLTSVGTITSGTWSGSFGAVSGANLTGLTAGNLSGTIPSAVLGNSTQYIGTTAVALNRASANLALTGISSVSFPGSTSGTAILQATASAGTPTLSLPTLTGTLVGTGDTGTVTNTMLAGSIAITKLASSAITINGTSTSLGGTINVGTVTSVAALTIGTSGTDVSSTVATGTTTAVITLNIPTASASNRGALSSADWTTFNNKITLSSAITGYTAGTNTALAATDTLLAALGKLQGQVTARGTGTVTSVATAGTVSGLTLTGGTITTTGTITLGGTLAVTPSNFASQTMNTVLAAPQNADGVPTFRNIHLSDMPSAWIKRAVNAATTAALTLNAAQTTIDGVTLSATSRVLIKNQATASQNGIYTNVTTTTWVRATDADVSSDIAGAFVNVDAGTVNGGKVFDTDFKSTDTIGTTAMNWYQNIDAGYLTTVGNSFATLTNPSAITFPRINADNTVSALDAATFAAALNISGGATVIDDTTTNASRYIVWEDVTSGSSSTIGVSSTKLYFNPSTGTLNATSFNSLSDVNFKENIKTIENSTETINKLDGVEFDWKDTKKHSYGVIAQKLEEILPELVETNDQGVKSVNYSGIIGFLINSIKEMDTRIKQLENK